MTDGYQILFEFAFQPARTLLCVDEPPLGQPALESAGAFVWLTASAGWEENSSRALKFQAVALHAVRFGKP